MSEEFKVGDRIEGVGKIYGKDFAGKKGTIKFIGFPCIACVEWDDYVSGHNCGGLAKQGHGWDLNLRFDGFKKIHRMDKETGHERRI